MTNEVAGRWLKPCARSVFISLPLRNFVRRLFHAPALGARVAQLGYLAAHGLVSGSRRPGAAAPPCSPSC